jgi:DHA3 family tetracycline resistance protein-like MFS transporter
VRRLRPETTYLVYATGEGFAFRMMSVLFSVFLIVELGLGPLELLLMGTVLELSYLLFEVPTGVVADTVSRRLSVVIGLVGSGIAFILLGFSGSFAIAMVSQALWGVFATFQSGADVAWLTDEIGEEAAQPMYMRGEQWGQAGALVGIVAGVAIAAVTDLRTPILVSGVGFAALGVFMWLAMREERFVPEHREGERLRASLATTMRDGLAAVRAHHVLMLILATAALHGMSTEGFDRLSDLHLLDDVGLPTAGGLALPVWFGILDGGALLLGIGALVGARRVLDRGYAAQRARAGVHRLDQSGSRREDARHDQLGRRAVRRHRPDGRWSGHRPDRPVRLGAGRARGLRTASPAGPRPLRAGDQAGHGGNARPG